MNAPRTSRPPAVCIEHTAVRVRAGMRLVDYMKDRLALVPVTEVGDLITEGTTWIRAGTNWVRGRTTDLVADGDRIAIASAALDRLRRGARWTPPWSEWLSIVHEDDDLVVVDKPAGMHVHPLGDRRERTLVNALVCHADGGEEGPWASWRPHVVQRLDFVVSGLVAVAKSAEAKAVLVRAQKSHGIERTYLAIVSGRMQGEAGIVDAPIGREPGRGYRRAVLAQELGGLRAVTRWRVLRHPADRTLVEVSPETGRTHQIRVHLAHLGHPIAGDSLYADAAQRQPPARIGTNRQNEAETMSHEETDASPAREPSAPIALHATRLRLPHPRTGKIVAFDSPAPPDFESRGD